MHLASWPASRVRWFLVFWLFVLGAVSYLDRPSHDVTEQLWASSQAPTQQTARVALSQFPNPQAFAYRRNTTCM